VAKAALFQPAWLQPMFRAAANSDRTSFLAEKSAAQFFDLIFLTLLMQKSPARYADPRWTIKALPPPLDNIVRTPPASIWELKRKCHDKPPIRPYSYRGGIGIDDLERSPASSLRPDANRRPGVTGSNNN
jgi:hypothetical protein